MAPRFEVARFHVETGPAELFERIRFKMRDTRVLKTHPGHVQERVAEHDAPIEQLQAFDPTRWRLMTAEVRVDKGKFVNSTWAVEVAGQEWWVVIGFESTMETVIRTNRAKRGLGPGIVRSGPLYEFVRDVNRELMSQELGGGERSSQ